MIGLENYDIYEKKVTHLPKFICHKEKTELNFTTSGCSTQNQYLLKTGQFQEGDCCGCSSSLTFPPSRPATGFSYMFKRPLGTKLYRASSNAMLHIYQYFITKEKIRQVCSYWTTSPSGRVGEHEQSIYSHKAMTSFVCATLTHHGKSP